MNKRYRSGLALVAICAVASTVITGCKSSGDAAADASASASMETNVSADAASESSTIQTELDDGELVLAQDAGQIGTFEGTLPDEQPDWDTIMANTPDAVAVISIPGTDMSLVPVASSGTDSQGLYVGEGNSTDFSDPVTILKNVSGADVYGDAEFFGKNPYIYIYQQGIVSEYKVFAAAEGNDENLLVKYNMYDYNEYNTFIDDVFATRSIGSSFDETLKDKAKSSWQTVILSTGEGSGLNVYFTLTGSTNS